LESGRGGGGVAVEVKEDRRLEATPCLFPGFIFLFFPFQLQSLVVSRVSLRKQVSGRETAGLLGGLTLPVCFPVLFFFIFFS